MPKVKYKCDYDGCEKEFYDYACNYRKFCSPQCAHIDMAIMRMGELPKGIKKWRENGGTSWNKGLKGYTSGNKNGNWKGGKYINQGYVYILMPNHPYAKKNGYVAEHRLVIEKCIGRFISKIESPHHKNKIRNDNRIKNLMLFKNKAIHNKADHEIEINKKDIIFDGLNYQRTNKRKE